MPRQPQGGKPPRYKQIADDLRNRIKSGEFANGGRLPGEKKLMEEYDVAQGTIRQALGVLRDEGLTEARPGAGVYVRTFRPIVRSARQRLTAEQWGQGQSMWDVDIDDRDLQVADMQIERLPAAPDLARVLGVDLHAPVWRRSRRYVVDGVPVMRAVSHIPDDLAEGTRITQVDTGPGGVYARLADAGHAPVHFREEIRLRMPSSEEAADLKLRAATPVAEINRYAFDAADRVVEVNRMVLDGSRYLLVYDISA